MTEKSRVGKLAVILHADVAGSTMLVHRNEQLAHERIRGTFQRFGYAITKYHGQVRELRGDALLAEFERVSDAVSAALAFQAKQIDHNAQLDDDIQPAVRVGIAMGEVIIADDTVTGAGVILAQRLEQLAEPGCVVIQGAAHETIPGRFPFMYDNLGDHVVKGFDDPVRVYSAKLKPGFAIPQPTPLTNKKRKTKVAAAAVFLIIAAVFFFRFGYLQTREASYAEAPLDAHRIAVLPFTNLSTGANDAYFADGLTEELISQLSRINDLRVIARTSVLQYKNANKGVDVIGRELEVGTILEGSVRKAGDKVRITAQLIDVPSQTHHWSRDYDRRLENIFEVQSDIAKKVGDALRITLLPEVATVMSTPGTNNPEAYDAYLQGLFYLQKRSNEDARKATDFFKQAIHLDPNFAGAYAKLSHNYYNSAYLAFDMSSEEVAALARDAAKKAIELDPNLADGYVQLAEVLLHYDWDWRGAEAALKKAVELNPSDLRAHKVLGHRLLSVVLRRSEEGITESQLAARLDPMSPSNQEGLGWAYYHGERFGDALAQFKKAWEMFPNQAWTGVGVAQSQMMLGHRDEALTTMEESMALRPDNALLQGFLAWAYGSAGETDKAKLVLEEIRNNEPYNPPAMPLAWGYTGLGDKEMALTWLDKAFQNRDFMLIFMQAPEFRQVLAGEPRYQQLREKLKLEGPAS